MTGMTISNIYYHYNSKEGLLFSVLESTTEPLIAELKKVSRLDIDPLERFRLLVKTHLTYHANHMREGRIFWIDEEQLSPEYMKKNKQYQKDIFSIYMKQLNILQAANITNNKHPTVTLFSLFGAINAMLRWYHPEGLLTLDQIIDDIIDFVLHGVLGSPSN